MRVIKEIPNEQLKITLFGWNNKFILKFEVQMYEQIYKFSEMDMSQSEVESLINQSFIDSVIQRFKDMDNDISKMIEY
jgi:hypothetical protein